MLGLEMAILFLSFSIGGRSSNRHVSPIKAGLLTNRSLVTWMVWFETVKWAASISMRTNYVNGSSFFLKSICNVVEKNMAKRHWCTIYEQLGRWISYFSKIGLFSSCSSVIYFPPSRVYLLSIFWYVSRDLCLVELHSSIHCCVSICRIEDVVLFDTKRIPSYHSQYF